MMSSTTEGQLEAAAGRSDRSARSASILLVLAATVILLLSGAFEPLEHRLTTARAQLLDRPPSGEVAIVEIDAKSLAEISTWPWSRRYYAQALRKLHSSGAVMVAFDVDFSSLLERAGDREFADALAEAQPVILPIFQQRASDDPSQQDLVRSRPAKLFDSAWVGGVNIYPEADGAVREYPAATMIGGRIQPSLPVLLAENDDFGDRSFQPDWSIDARRIPRFSFVDLIRGRVPATALAGKRVVIGATAVELGDRYTIPRFGMVPGVVVQALAADSLLQHRALTRSGMLPSLLGVGLVALLLGAVRFRRFNRTFPPAAAAVLVLPAVAAVAIQARWPVSVDTAAILFCTVACIVVRVTLEVRSRVRASALVDRETGLPNELSLAAALANSQGSKVILAAAGFDRWDHIRDGIGKQALVELVLEASARIERVIGQPIYRIAPDTLGWVVPGDQAPDLAPLFREPVQTREGAVDIHLTIGMDGGEVGHNVQLKIERALAAIGSARAAGEHCQWYQGSDPLVRRELSLMGELRRGMAQGEVSVAYQPKLDIATGWVTHAEALVRWRHPTDGFISPDRFVPLAESTGVIRELTGFVLRQAAADVARLRALGTPIRIAVNVSAADIGNTGFIDEVLDVIGHAGIDAGSLTLEVTESAIISSPATAIAVLTALRGHGIEIAIDDYGTGQSTLSYLKQLPVDELKIDKSFVTSVCEDDNDRIMVRSTINLSHELGLKVVAEGVEDAATLELLRSLECDYAQGYLIGKAMPVEQLSQLAASPAGARKVA
jgi:EAL domain-containing protein (putative c-di-GMP-specific phosphodiesterase class I)/CHASE2 domain-containing sensor protein